MIPANVNRAPTVYMLYLFEIMSTHVVSRSHTIYTIGGIVLFFQFIRTDKGAMLFDKFKLRVPVFGMIIRKVAVSKFSRTLAFFMYFSLFSK
jgi:type II secretory pathway component PulF